MKDILKELKKKLSEEDFNKFNGRVTRVVGLTVESKGPDAFLGEMCKISLQNGKNALAEVVGFREESVILMPYEDVSGLKMGCEVIRTNKVLEVGVSRKMIGRVFDGLGRPIDGKPFVPEDRYPLTNNPPNPLKRRRIKDPLPVGIRSIDGLITVGKGQRIGIFAGSGVGKSTLLGMIARNTTADVNVLALIGERGREVREFIERDLGEEGLKRSILVVSTSDQPALARVKSLLTATSIAEFFRDLGYDVLLMVDSLTRWAMAQREVGLAVGEPPTTRGYPPSVFAGLPKILERAGNSDKGSITAIYTVLVEADDFNEPISDTVRSIVDGHIILSRRLAESNHYPAVDVLASVSRLMNDIVTEEHREAANRLRSLMSAYESAKDLIEIGAYKSGTNPLVDKAVEMKDEIDSFLKQGVFEKSSFEETLQKLLDLYLRSLD
ncbi:MAG: Flagellar protein export ATPase FliI [Thermotoga sp. 47_83]|uniref:Flagellar protein export ATPase FliI n=2 Tax=Thermotoga petrophila TaxID=93929 RepID=D2C7K4_THEP2|nr:flagellar protein export ATPase FliI [Thermotoga petrophila]KUK33560.1 MAG: Flagellar protein export ATPase FliI [Thermotoga sp. 47_83]ADA66940.1 flagellar protein export ATPase FliI [Thermotoga petrophila RKU-10]KUK22244.1 MAG: Flagellar protein export ATPase FliI [Thermotoga petrophila]HAA81832.1 flagellar protein export ATPase FliI [Thermotoga petrophila]HBT99830.1 flagellar protein export ATPase FliI [Thermotoga petrophila]